MAFSDVVSQYQYTETVNDQQVTRFRNNTLAVSMGSDVPQVSDENEDTWAYDETYDRYLIQYIDEEYATVDTSKTVTVNGNQINITQEINSQVIPFQIKRYWEGVDLADKHFLIHYVNAGGNENYSVPVNFRYSEQFIRFYWLVDEYATAVAGALQFEIIAVGSNEKKKDYVWKTRPNTGSLNVVRSLAGNSTIERPDDWVTSFLNRVNVKVGEATQAASDAQKAANRATEAIAQLDAQASSIEQKIVNDVNDNLDTLVSNKLEPYALKSEIDGLENLQVDYDIDSENETYTLTFYNNKFDEDDSSRVIASYNIQTNPTTVWKNVFRQELIDDEKLGGAITALADSLLGENGAVTKNASDISGLQTDVQSLKGKISTAQGDSYYTAAQVDAELNKKVSTTTHKDLTNKLTKMFGEYYETGADVYQMIEDINEQLASGTGGGGSVNPEDLYRYYVTYDSTNEDENKRYMFTLWEYKGEYDRDENDNFKTEYKDGEPQNQTIVTQFKILGGSGGQGSTANSVVSVIPVTGQRYVALNGSRVVLQYKYKSIDNDGYGVNGTAVWTLNNTNTVIGSQSVYTATTDSGPDYATYEFDITDYVTSTPQDFRLVVTDTNSATNRKSWTVNYVDFNLTSSFDDTVTYSSEEQVRFRYTPNGAIPKTVHIILHDDLDEDGNPTHITVDLDSTTTGKPQQRDLPLLSHGSHLVEVYMTTNQFLVDGKPLQTASIFKDIMVVDPTSQTPVIGCSDQTITSMQYNTAQINYTVYDPLSENPIVTISVDGKEVSSQTLTNGSHIYTYKGTEVGEHTITISCKDTTKTITVNVVKIDIKDTVPITHDLDLDFNPVGYSNRDISEVVWTDGTTHTKREWTDGTNHMIVSDNFDWVNGGYQLDADGDQYFCIKAGTTASFDYKLFGNNDTKKRGKEFKLIYKVTNVRDIDTKWLDCLDTDSGVGIYGTPHHIYISSSSQSLDSPLSEEDLIEFEFNISPSSGTDQTTDKPYIPMVMTYENGVAYRPMIYDAEGAESFTQTNGKEQFITIGSEDCDVHIYRMKCYNSRLDDMEIIDNFICDAKNAEEMINRFNRNDIYDAGGNLSPELLSQKFPDLYIVKISCPMFTKGKKNYVGKVTETINGESKTFTTSVECLHGNGGEKYKHWKFENVYISGQGTTQDHYGAQGRNIDIVMCADGKNSILQEYEGQSHDYHFDPTYITKLTLNDGTVIVHGEETVGEDGKTTIAEAKVPLTPTSIPNNWFNLKVNIASSENANNALLQNRYNTFVKQLYTTVAQKKDSRAKNSMEFVNCVIFLQESDEDLSTHREFKNDTNWHFYAIGNLGDSKKTDATRANNPDDDREFCVEFKDNDKDNTTFDTGVYNADGSIKYPISVAEWEDENNKKYVALRDNWDKSFEFRYEMGGALKDGMGLVDDEEKAAQELVNKQILRDFYKWVITSSNEDFANHLQDWFVKDSALFWYLFTERYTMIDNRAKNSFWHWSKVYISNAEASEMGDDAQYYTIDDAAAAINDGYRFDMWDYDNDTALGIDNYGKMSFTYGLEDTDKVESTGVWVFNGAESVFWRRIRENMYPDLSRVYRLLDAAGCWSADSLINQFDNWQAQFPEQLWREDIERKYYRPYRAGGTSGVNGAESNDRFLKNMMNGRKHFQRRQFERDQDMYMGSKYLTPRFMSDEISLRFTRPANYVVTPNYNISLVPYSDMYLSIQFGAGATPVQYKAKAGELHTFVQNNPEDTYIFGASRIQEVSDLSAAYVVDCDFNMARKIKKVVIGNETEGYVNNAMTRLVVGEANTLLEYLDVRNCPNLSGSLDLSKLFNLKTVLAQNTGYNSVSFANGGLLEEAHLPAINALSIKNLQRLDILDVADDFKSLRTLIVENCGKFDKTIIEKATSLLRLRAIGIDWFIELDTLLKSMLGMSGISATNDEIDQSVVTGKVQVSRTDSYSMEQFNDAWPNLDIVPINEPDEAYLVTFVNPDNQLLGSTHVIKGQKVDDPVLSGVLKDAPTYIERMPDGAIATDYTFTGKWKDPLTGNVIALREYDPDTQTDVPYYTIYDNTTFVADYETSPHQYTVRFVNKADSYSSIIKEVQAPYGATVEYSGPTPTYTALEDATGSGIYYLFKGWDVYPVVTGNITVNTVYEKYNYNPVELSQMSLGDMSPVQIYSIVQHTTMDGLPFQIDNSDSIKFTMGNEYEYSNVETTDIIASPMTFTGESRSYYRSAVSLLTEDKDWILVVDYMMQPSIGNNRVLFSCYETNGASTGVGFRLMTDMNSTPRLQWGSTSVQIGLSKGVRDMIALRHKKGDNKLYIYAGNQPYAETLYFEASATSSVQSGELTKWLTFGGYQTNQNEYSQYGAGTIYSAKIYWTDIGDDACKSMVLWPHEEIEMYYGGSQRYNMGNDRLTAMNFIGAHLLANKYAIPKPNTGGWLDSNLANILNDRFYNAIPIQYRQLIKKCQIGSNSGYNDLQSAPTVNYKDLYIAIPSIAEIDSSSYQEPYSLEGGALTLDHVCYDNMGTAAQRVRRYPDGSVGTYATRSPQYSSSDYWYVVLGDPSDIASAKQYSTQATEGSIYYYTWNTWNIGVLIEFSF